MKKMYIAVTYDLFCGEPEELMERATETQPFTFYSGVGMALERFENEILATELNGTFDFTIPAEGIQTYRTLVEIDLSDGVHLFPGEEIPEGCVVKQNETYMEDDSIAFKVMHKRSVPYMSAFEVGTSFFNPRSLTENHYLTFGHNTLTYLKNYPCITATFAE